MQNVIQMALKWLLFFSKNCNNCLAVEDLSFRPHQSTELGISKKHRRAQAEILQLNYFVYFKMQTEIPQPNIFKLKAQAQIPQP